MTYPEAIKYLDSFIDYEKIPQYPYKQCLKLERIKGFLETLNNPQDDCRCIHIAGTKGKGSTCAFIAYILRAAGFKVGLYTSPHLSDFCERIRILQFSPSSSSSAVGGSGINRDYQSSDFEGMISKEELTFLIERLRPYIERYNSQSKYGPLSFFEIYTALAFMYFKEKEVDFAVLETGLGGRLDATNTVNPLIVAITPISYEHTKYLGRTLTKITQEKAGIIKAENREQRTENRVFRNRQPVIRSPIVITAPQEKEVIEVIRDRCVRQNAILYEIGKDILYRRKESPQCFDIDGTFGRLDSLKIGLIGKHQIINATLASAVVLALSSFYQARPRPVKGISSEKGRRRASKGVNLEAIRNGLYNTTWPGRFEIIPGKRLVVLDGAQNLASAQALKDALIENFPNRRIILVLGISQDKDIKGICQVLIPISNEVILTKANNPRAADADVIEHVIRKQKTALRLRSGLEDSPEGSYSKKLNFGIPKRDKSSYCIREKQINKTRQVREAIELANEKAGPEDLILITGSLYLVGEARELLAVTNTQK